MDTEENTFINMEICEKVLKFVSVIWKNQTYPILKQKTKIISEIKGSTRIWNKDE